MRLLRALGSSEAAYFVSFNLTNALNYLYLAAMGLVLTTQEYGLFVALFGVVYLVSALGNTIQVSTATHVARVLAVRGNIGVRDYLVSGGPALAVAVLMIAALLAATPILSAWFESPSGPVLWASLAAALSVLVPFAYGALQGLQRFTALGLSQLVMAASRVLSGFVLVAAGLGTSGALAAVALGYVPSALLALAFLRRDDTAPSAAIVSGPSLKFLIATLVASVVIAAPTSLDVALIRHFLPEVEAGAFAGMAVMGRVVLFVPLSISIVILPKAAADAAKGARSPGVLRNAIALTAALTIACAGFLALLAVAGWSPVGDDIHFASDALPWYLLAMVMFALAVPSIYYRLGQGDLTFVPIVVAGLVAQALAVLLLHESLAHVSLALLGVNLATALLLLLPRRVFSGLIGSTTWGWRSASGSVRTTRSGADSLTHVSSTRGEKP